VHRFIVRPLFFSSVAFRVKCAWSPRSFFPLRHNVIPKAFLLSHSRFCRGKSYRGQAKNSGIHPDRQTAGVPLILHAKVKKMKKNNTGLFGKAVPLVLSSWTATAKASVAQSYQTTEDGSQQIIPDDSSTESIIS
jgi:hypothetical protein